MLTTETQHPGKDQTNQHAASPVIHLKKKQLHVHLIAQQF